MVAKKKNFFIQQIFWKAVKKMSKNIKQWNEQFNKKKKHSGSTQKSNIQPTWVLQKQNRENREEETVMKKKG